MKKLQLAPAMAVLMMLGLTACPQTSVPRNFGAKPLALKTEDWQGTWQIAGENDDLRFVVKDAAAGQITVLEPDAEKKKDKDEPVEIVIRETGAKEDGARAFMIVMSEPGGDRGSLNLITVANKGTFHSWNMKHDVVEAAVKSGELKGEVKEVQDKGDQKPHNHTSLHADPANYDKLMDPKYWDWSEPGTFVRKQGK